LEDRTACLIFNGKTTNSQPFTQAFRKEIAHASSGHDKHSEERVRTSLAVPTMGKGYSSLEEALEAVRKMASGDSVAIVDVTGGATEADKRKMN